MFIRKLIFLKEPRESLITIVINSIVKLVKKANLYRNEGKRGPDRRGKREVKYGRFLRHSLFKGFDYDYRLYFN